MSIQDIIQEHVDQAETEAAFEWFFALYQDDIDSIARRESAGRHYIDSDDVASAVIEAVLSEWKQFKGCEAREVRAMLKRRAQQYVQREQVDYAYFTGSFIYTPQQVRHHLEESTWGEVEDASDVDARADMLSAWKKLSPATRQAVYERYGLGIAASDMTEAARKAANRGVDQIAAHLNHAVPHALSTSEETL